jgi:hypothetical protein
MIAVAKRNDQRTVLHLTSVKYRLPGTGRA